MPAAILGAVVIFGMIGYGVMSVWAACLGLGYSLGTGWAIGIVVVSLFFRFTLPLTVGAFLGAMYVWHWHWLGALLFAAPGLAFVVPGVMASIFAMVPWKRTA